MALSAVVFAACGVIIVRVQQNGGDGTSDLRPLIYGVAVAFLLGGALCFAGLVSEGRRWSFPLLVAGAVLATIAISVPSLLSAAFPFVCLVWGYVYWRWSQRRGRAGEGG